MKKINANEIDAVLALPAPKRYEYGIKIIADWGEVWSLKDKNGWVASQSSSGKSQFSIWPHPVYAQLCANNAWADNVPEKIDLELWLSEWLPNMEKKDM